MARRIFKIFNILLGDKFAPNGVMANDIYLALLPYTEP
jgi:cytochrome c oxidase subunit 1